MEIANIRPEAEVAAVVRGAEGVDAPELRGNGVPPIVAHALRFIGTKGETMKTLPVVSLLTALLLTSVVILPAHADGCSGRSCSECGQDTDGYALCTTVSKSASCECTISVSNPRTCTIKGVCSYSSGGGGGIGGGGGTGGGGCARTPGEWCPADCSSCTTVFWY